MNLVVRDAVFAAIAERAALAVEGVSRLHTGLLRGRSGGVEVDRAGVSTVLTVRLVVVRGQPIIELVRAVQRSVRGEVERLTGVIPEVVVVVVDLD